MDVTFKTNQGRFNYRVCAVILKNERLLVLRDDQAPYFYLPGGRVKLHETAEHALRRELKEELNIRAEICRPLWLCQSFFSEVISQESFHELCLFYLVDGNQNDLAERGDAFTVCEGKTIHHFEWLPFSKLRDVQLYPLFIKQEIFHLPHELTIITEYQ